MDYYTLGNTGLKVSQLALGTMTFGNDWGWGADESASRAIFDTYVEAGGNFFDGTEQALGGPHYPIGKQPPNQHGATPTDQPQKQVQGPESPGRCIDHIGGDKADQMPPEIRHVEGPYLIVLILYGADGGEITVVFYQLVDDGRSQSLPQFGFIGV